MSEIEVKRFYVDGLSELSGPCPKCGTMFTGDDGYLSYPTANVWFDHTLWCSSDDCDHEWPIKVKLLCAVVPPDERIPLGGDATDYSPSDLMRIAGAAWDVQHLLPHPDDVDQPEWAAALREFNRAMQKHPPLEKT